MKGLPFDLRFELGSQEVHLVHGSPRKVNEYLFEDKPASLYERLARAEEARMLVFGHTHKPWIHTYGGRVVRQLRVGRQTEGRRPTRRRSRSSSSTRPEKCGRRSSGCPTTPRRSPEKSPRPASPASTPTSWSPPHEKEKDR